MEHIKTVEEFNELIKGKKVVIDFFANWCGPCKMLAPIFEEVSNEFSDIKFAKVDIDEVEDLPKMFGIMSIPTLLIFEEGKLVKKISGYLGKDELIKFINN